MLKLRAADHSVTEIARALTADGWPISVQALRPLGPATGTQGFNLDFHAIRHHGSDAVLEKHYVPRRSQHRLRRLLAGCH